MHYEQGLVKIRQRITEMSQKQIAEVAF